MTQYLIRSMAMTDYPPRYNKLPEPFHTYLLKPEKRHGGSCWSIYCGHVQLFDFIADALAHGAAVLGDERFDVIPAIDLELPTLLGGARGNPPRSRHRHRDREGAVTMARERKMVIAIATLLLTARIASAHPGRFPPTAVRRCGDQAPATETGPRVSATSRALQIGSTMWTAGSMARPASRTTTHHHTITSRAF